MAKKQEPKSNTPLFIIGGVLIVALLGGWWLLSSAKSSTNSNTAKTTNSNANRQMIPPNAPPGAIPPHESGSPTAPVTLEEFADFQCPQCAATHPILNEVKSIYGSRIRFIFRDFPLDIPAHDKAYDAAVAAEAAYMQNPNKFWDMQNMLFTNQRVWTTDPNYKQVWKDYAQKIGLDVNKWETDMAGLGSKTRVDEDKKRGKAVGVTATPSLYINGQLIPFQEVTVDGLRKIIDAELQKSAPQGQSAPPVANANATK